jgi:hypothetical protein
MGRRNGMVFDRIRTNYDGHVCVLDVEDVAVTAPERRFPSMRATEEAWQSRVQWSTLLWPNGSSFGTGMLPSFVHLADPKPTNFDPCPSYRWRQNPALVP